MINDKSSDFSRCFSGKFVSEAPLGSYITKTCLSTQRRSSVQQTLDTLLCDARACETGLRHTDDEDDIGKPQSAQAPVAHAAVDPSRRNMRCEVSFKNVGFRRVWMRLFLEVLYNQTWKHQKRLWIGDMAWGSIRCGENMDQFRGHIERAIPTRVHKT